MSHWFGNSYLWRWMSASVCHMLYTFMTARSARVLVYTILTLCFCVCVFVCLSVWEVMLVARRSTVNPAHLLIRSLAWQRSSPAKAVSHKNQPLSQHITAAGISNSTGNPGNHSQCPQYAQSHTQTHTQTNQGLHLICSQGVFLYLPPSISSLVLSIHTSFLPSIPSCMATHLQQIYLKVTCTYPSISPIFLSFPWSSLPD